MRRFLTVLAVAMAFTSSYKCSASVLDPFRGITLIEDNDREGIIGDGDSIVEVGEYLVAVAEFPGIAEVYGTDIGAFTPTTPMLTGLSLLKVTGVTPSGGGTAASFTFAAPTMAEWLTETGLAVTGDDTVLLTYDDPSIPTPHITNTSLATAIASTTNGTRMYEFGLVSGASFWTASTTSVTDATDILLIDGLNFYAALDLIATTSGPPLGKHNFLGTPSFENPLGPGIQALYTGATELQLFGVRAASTIPGSAALPLPTDTDGYLNILPEPMSFIVWGGIAAIAAGGAYRRRVA